MLLPPPEGSITATGPWRPEQGQRVQPREAHGLEVLADAGEQEVVGGLVDEVLVLALTTRCRVRTVEHRHRAAEVVDHRGAPDLVDDVARRHEGGRDLAEAVEVGRAALHLDRHVGRRPVLVGALEPDEVEPQVLDDLGPVAGHPEPEPVHLQQRHAYAAALITTSAETSSKVRVRARVASFSSSWR